MYPNPYDSYEWGTADPLTGNPCPVCGAPRGQCVDVAGAPVPITPLTYDAVDIGDPVPDNAGGALRNYRVTQFGYTSVMQLNDEDAAAYGSAAVLIS